MSLFKKLSEINVNEHVKTKMNLSYLSWAFAWGELQKACPDSSYKFNPVEYYQDGSAEVSVDVTVDDITRNMLLPVMDNRNNAIKNPNSRQISDARMRCLVKAIAMFGLGLYIYAGEDLPQETIKDYKAEFEATKTVEELLKLWDSLTKPEQKLNTNYKNVAKKRIA